MDRIEKKLQNLPQVEPDYKFVSSLKSRLLKKHILESKQKTRIRFSFSSFAWSGVAVLLIFIISGIVISSDFLGKSEVDNLTIEGGNQKEMFSPNASLEVSKTNDGADCGCSQDTPMPLDINVSGYLRKNPSFTTLYQLEVDNQMMYLVKSNTLNLNNFLDKELYIWGKLYNCDDSTKIIDVNNLEIKN